GNRRDVAIEERPATVLNGVMPPSGNLYRVAVRTEEGAIFIVEGSRSLQAISEEDRRLVNGVAALIRPVETTTIIESTYGSAVNDDTTNALIAPKMTLDSYLFGSIFETTRANTYLY